MRISSVDSAGDMDYCPLHIVASRAMVLSFISELIYRVIPVRIANRYSQHYELRILFLKLCGLLRLVDDDWASRYPFKKEKSGLIFQPLNTYLWTPLT